MHFFALTSGSRILSHRGLMKNTIPFHAPSNVTARTSSMPMMTYGNKARKYDALPELRMPRINTAAITIQATSKKNAKFNIGVPIPCLISLASANTSLLYGKGNKIDLRIQSIIKVLVFNDNLREIVLRTGHNFRTINTSIRCSAHWIYAIQPFGLALCPW